MGLLAGGAREAFVLAGDTKGPCAFVAGIAGAHAADGAHWLRRLDLGDSGVAVEVVELGRQVEPVVIVGGASGRAREALLVGRDIRAVVVDVVVGPCVQLRGWVSVLVGIVSCRAVSFVGVCRYRLVCRR